MEKRNRVHKFLNEELTVRAAGVIATPVVEEMRSIQHSYPIATVATGRAMVGALLLASQLKVNQELSLYFRGNGPLSTIFAEANYEGKVRGYTGNPQLNIPLEGEAAIKVGPAIGIGLLTVTHFLPGHGTPHRGTVIIRTGEIGDDIAFYLQQSHQIPSVVALGVHVDKYGRVEAAGGILIELMPGATEETVAEIEARVATAPSISKRILEGASAEDLVRDYLGESKLLQLTHEHDVQYQCRCSMDRARRSIALLGMGEVDKMISEKKPLDVTCEFCGRPYVISEADLVEMRKDMYKESLN